LAGDGDGIKEATAGKAIFSYHTLGGENSNSQYLNWEDWLDYYDTSTAESPVRQTVKKL
jgi:hypothetical protein